MNSDYPWKIALVSTEPKSSELMEYAIKAMFPETVFFASHDPRWWLQNLSEQRPSAVVTSQKLLGDLDGLSFASALREIGFRGPIMMLSNAEELADSVAAFGIDEFLSFARWPELPARLAALLVGAQTYELPHA